MLPLPKSCVHSNVLQPKANADQNIQLHRWAKFHIAKRFMREVIFKKTPSLILSDEKYWTVQDAWILFNEAQGSQQV